MEKDKDEKHLNSRKMLSKMKYEENKIKLPIKNMCYKNDPPAFITVVGSKNSGKSSVIKSLVKKFTKQTLDHIKGPITLTVSVDKRVTIFECKDDIHQFVDTSKISDMVIFIIDATVGLECETLEYLSLLLAHGLPKIAFVVTHTDKKNVKKMFKKIKKQIYDEICDGLKFFYLGMNDGKYNESEILNMTRFISSMKYRPIEWKCTHPHIIIDKIDDINIYGYVRGASINKGVDVHIPGFGDTKIKDFEILDDPVPTKIEKKLSTKKMLLYAPMIHKEQVKVEICTEEIKDTEIEQVEEIKLFKKSKNKLKTEIISTEEIVIPEVTDMKQEIIIDNLEENVISDSDEDLEAIKEKVKNKFRKEVKTEEDFVEKFNEKYTEEEKNLKNFYTKEKDFLEESKLKNVSNKLRDVSYPGEYIKITLENMVDKKFDFSKILILGVYLVSELKQEILQGKVKTNKWHKRLLKTNDPLIFSVGWRRFQSIPVYSSKTSGENRMLKYSFKHGFCLINFYGFVVPPGTGFSIYSEKSKFKVLGYGNILDVTGDHNLVKKLKLVGYPSKIMGNTAFIKDMFTSNLEVLKFKNAKIKTVSGLKGNVKNPVGKNGEFRGAFEGEMLMSDIVTLKCFVPFPLHKILIPVNNLVETWKGLRSLREIREEFDIKIEDKYIEEVSHEESNDEESEEFVLPEEIEKRLPLDKRNIKVINEKIELPISPEEKRRKIFENEIELKRKQKEIAEQKEAEKIKSRKEKEKERFLEEKQERLKKTIIKSNLQKKRNRK
ncbi:ribosome biogenesis protein BMS1 [Vairimorpha necatrix]|uniref:Ribosome biogenesis protein BMS1 n=1 Tax=Vairimorpha necatrix TaxID=6039 RepID=A0AAX4JC33_9MICR